MLKNLFLAIAAFSSFSGSAYACKLNTIETAHVREVVQQHGGWPISDEKCAILNQNRLALYIDGHATVLNNVSVGWAAVKLGEPDLHIVSDRTRLATTVNNSIGSMTTANDSLYDAIRDAIAGLEFDVAAKEVKQYQLKAARQAPAAPANR